MHLSARRPTRKEKIKGQAKSKTYRGSNEEHRSEHEREAEGRLQAESRNQTQPDPDELADLANPNKPIQTIHDLDNWARHRLHLC